MYPTKEEAELLLKDAASCNPGRWVGHSKTAAHCAERIAFYTGMNPDKAYVLGLLHDIGRKFGVSYMRHISDGYTYMLSLGYDDVARICLTHSFCGTDINTYVGKTDTTEEETEMIRTKLAEIVQDEYDELIQFVDSIAGTEGVMDIIDRMTDVKNRYGSYNPGMWANNLRLKDFYEKKMGMDLYEAVDKENYRPK